MYSGVELQGVNVKRPFVELIPASHADLDLLVNAGRLGRGDSRGDGCLVQV